MPAFAVIPASPADLPAFARTQFESCADDPGFSLIFPQGATPSSIQFKVQSLEHEMEHDPTGHLMIVKDALTGEIASYAAWHFFPARSPEAVEEEMLQQSFPLPSDANHELGNKLIRNGMRKRHEVVSKEFGMGAPYAYLSALGTNPNHQRQGAASMLVRWGIDYADDENLPAYLESTPSGRSLYARHGFREVEQFRLELAPFREGDFFNVCMVRPKKIT